MALFCHYNESYSELHHSIVIRLKQKYLLHIMAMRDFLPDLSYNAQEITNTPYL